MSDSKVCADKIGKLDKELAKLSAAKDESNAVAEKDRADYLKEHADYSESVDSLARGIQQFQSGIPAGLVQEDRLVQSARFEALIQLQRLSKMPVHAKRVLASFLELKEDPDFFKDESADALAVSAPESGAYAAQIGGIVDMLKKLLTKFKDELYTLEQEEMKRKGAQEVVIQDLKRQIEAATE